MAEEEARKILAEIAKRIKELETDFATAKELISAMREAGEDVTELEAMLREVESRKRRWEMMLRRRGIIR